MANIMAIYRKEGVDGVIKTSGLPSGYLAVEGPSSGPLEKIVFDSCRGRGDRQASGKWYVRPEHIGWVNQALQQSCAVATS